jgi:hypothetical protein
VWMRALMPEAGTIAVLWTTRRTASRMIPSIICDL